MSHSVDDHIGGTGATRAHKGGDEFGQTGILKNVSAGVNVVGGSGGITIVRTEILSGPVGAVSLVGSRISSNGAHTNTARVIGRSHDVSTVSVGATIVWGARRGASLAKKLIHDLDGIGVAIGNVLSKASTTSVK